MATLFKSLLGKVTGGDKRSAGRNGSRQLAENVLAYLKEEFRLLPIDVVALRCVSHRGSFAGMPAKFIRIFDGVKACEQGVAVESYRDLDKHPELVLFEGHILGVGTVCLTKTKSA